MIIKQNSLTWNGTFKPRQETKYIIFHHAKASKCSLEDIHKWHLQNGWIGCGYNFLIRKDGTVYEGRPIWAEGAHTIGYNHNSLGVCFEGDFMTEQMTDAQVNAGIDLLRDCRIQYPALQGGRHKDFNMSDCPGVNFQDKIILDGMKDVVAPVVDDGFRQNLELLQSYGKISSPDYWLTNVNADGDVTVKGEYLKAVFASYAELIKGWY